MGIHVALNHKTVYRYDRPVSLSPQIVRLRPAPHSRTPILSYSMTVTPRKHFINWQQDPFSNYLGRLVFPEKTREFCVEIDLVADMIVINPFDFFLAPEAETFPFTYEPRLKSDLAPYLASISGKYTPTRLMIGFIAMRKACLRTTLRSFNPLALAVWMYCWFKMSSMLPRTSRIVFDVPATPIATIGAGRCLRKSTTLAQDQGAAINSGENSEPIYEELK